MRKISWLAAVVVLAGCSDQVASLSLDPATLEFSEKGASQTLKAEGRAATGAPMAAAADFTSSDPSVATVEANGKVTALKSGTTTITATSGQVKATAKVTVLIPASVEVTPATATLTGPEQSTTFTAVVKDDTGQKIPDAVIFWKSSDKKVAEVENSGKATSVGEGTATITAMHSSVSGSATLTVKIPVFAKIVIKPSNVTIKKSGQKQKLTATAVDAKNKPVDGVPLTWKSSNAKIASVSDSGEVTGVKKGKAKITVESGKKTASVNVTVAK